jgi:hypothetical protein
VARLRRLGVTPVFLNSIERYITHAYIESIESSIGVIRVLETTETIQRINNLENETRLRHTRDPRETRFPSLISYEAQGLRHSLAYPETTAFGSGLF